MIVIILSGRKGKRKLSNERQKTSDYELTEIDGMPAQKKDKIEESSDSVYDNYHLLTMTTENNYPSSLQETYISKDELHTSNEDSKPFDIFKHKHQETHNGISSHYVGFMRASYIE